MKVPLQLASVSAGSAKPGPSVFHGKGTFGTAMDEIVASFSAKAEPTLLNGTWPGPKAQMGTHPETSEPDGVTGWAGKATQIMDQARIGRPFAVIPPSQTPESEVGENQLILQNPKPPGSPVPKQTAPEALVQAATPERPTVDSATTRQYPTPVAEQGSQQLRQPLVTAVSDLSVSSEDVSPRATHKAETAKGGSEHSANVQTSLVPPAATQTDLVASLPMLPLDGLQPVQLKTNANAGSSGIPVGGGTRRGRLQTAISGKSELHGNSLTAGGPPAMGQDSAISAVKPAKTRQGFPSTMAGRSNGPQQASAINGKTNTVAIPQANPSLPSNAVHSTADNAEPTASSIDSQALKPNEVKSGTEVKDEIKANIPEHPVPLTTAVQHQPAPNVPLAAVFGTEKAAATHRPESSATQVLQRMDMAVPSGVVQLRADARRLDVGVSSSALGWVEVRATSGPSGRVDATLQVSNDVSAHVLASQSREISDYAREHSVQLGQLSVGVGSGDTARGDSRPAPDGARHGDQPESKASGRPLANQEQTYRAADTVSLISVRA